MTRSPNHAGIRSGKRDPPPNVIPCPAFRAYEDNPVDFTRGFDRRIFSGIHPEKRGVEPVVISTRGTYAEFILDITYSYFIMHRHGNLLYWSTFRLAILMLPAVCSCKDDLSSVFPPVDFRVNIPDGARTASHRLVDFFLQDIACRMSPVN